jgi:predicted nuclease of predicted toxin-antitoxin system
MDAHVPGPITQGLRLRSVAVRTAQEDGSDTFDDPDLLDRAQVLGCVLVTQDVDFLIEAARRQRAGLSFAGVVYAHQLRVTIGRCIDDLELMAKVYDPVDMMNQVEHLPL